MRSSDHINQALTLFIAKNPHALVSVKRASPSVFKTYEVCSDGTIKGLFGLDAPYSSRQIFPELLSPNGAIYIFRAQQFSEQGKIPRTGVMPFKMDDQSSLDIDSPNDLALFENLLNSNE
jgi:N-acylneuraminate cytidylyltransferase